MQVLNLALLVDFKNIDPFEVNFVALPAHAAARPFNRRAVTSNEDLLLVQTNFFEGTHNRLEKVARA